VYRRLSGTREALYEQRSILLNTEKEMKIINLGAGLFVHLRILSALKRTEFVSDKKGKKR
jgi:hypothetical protein